MDYSIVSLIFLIIAIILGFTKKMNTGLVAIGLAMVVGRLAGMKDGAIIGGFGTSLFIMLLGVTYLFSIASINGTLELFAKKVVALAGKRTNLVPIVVFLLAAFISAMGPGGIPVMALMAAFTMPLAAQMNISPLLLAPVGLLGALAGGVTPIAPTGIIGITLMADQGFTNLETPFLLNSLLSLGIYSLIVYFALGGYKIKSENPLKFKDLEPFNTSQKITLAGIAAMVLGVLIGKINVGLMSFFVAAVLSFMGVVDEKKAVSNIPWGTLMLVTGVGVLMNVIVVVGGITKFTDFLTSFMTEKTATPIIALISGIMSWFSSTSGVVMPTMIPTVSGLLESMPGIEPVALLSAITNTAHVAGLSPLSTGGALALASYVASANVSPEDEQKLFIRFFGIAVGGVITLSILAGLGLYNIFV